MERKRSAGAAARQQCQNSDGEMMHGKRNIKSDHGFHLNGVGARFAPAPFTTLHMFTFHCSSLLLPIM